jgi:hypothetical protein
MQNLVNSVYSIAQVKSRGFSTDLGKQWYAIEAWRPEKFEVFEVEVTRLHVLHTRVVDTLPAKFGGGVA